MHIEKNLRMVLPMAQYIIVQYITVHHCTVLYYRQNYTIWTTHNEVLSLFMFGFKCAVLYANAHYITVHYITLWVQYITVECGTVHYIILQYSTEYYFIQ